jgi:Flp pilus assembly protein CpaB
MKKTGGRFLLILGAGLAVMAFVVVYVFMSRDSGKVGAAPAPTPAPEKMVAVVNQDVPAYTVLDATNVVLVPVDESAIQPDATTDINNLMGKMTKVSLNRNQQVRDSQLLTSGFSSVLEKGKRAYTLPIKERNTFGGALVEDDYVDLLWTHKYEVSQFVAGPDGQPVEKTKVLPTTKTLLQNVRVMRMITLRVPTQQQNQGGDAQAQPAAANRQAAAPATAYAVDAPVQAVLVVEVNDQQAEVIKFANENGEIDLALRSSAPLKDEAGQPVKGPDGKDIIGDHDPEKTTGITDKVLVEQYGLLLPEILVK